MNNDLAKKDQNKEDRYLEVLNWIEVDEVKILDSILENTSANDSVRKHYTGNRTKLEKYFNSFLHSRSTETERVHQPNNIILFYKASLQDIKLLFK